MSPTMRAMEHSTGSFIARGGVTIFTRTWRPSSGTPRARVVLVHGFGEHSGRYAHVAAALTEAGLVVTAPDLRGHGRSGGPRALVRIDEQVGDVALLLSELERTDDADLPLVLVGHSMGGAVVTALLQGMHPEVAAVVLSGPYVRNAVAVPAPLRLLAPVIGRVLPTLPTQGLDPSTVSRDADVVADYAADPLVHHGGVPAGTGAELLGLEGRLMPAARTITEPVLVVHGGEDLLADVDGSRALVVAWGGPAELTVHPGLYHEVFNEPERDDVLAGVVAWLEDVLDPVAG